MGGMKKLLLAILAVALAAPAAAATPAPLKGSQYLSQTKITPAQATKRALAVEHGKVVDLELEREKGGSGLRYSFDIQVGKVVHEVGIDAVTGRVLEDSIDNGDD